VHAQPNECYAVDGLRLFPAGSERGSGCWATEALGPTRHRSPNRRGFQQVTDADTESISVDGDAGQMSHNNWLWRIGGGEIAHRNGACLRSSPVCLFYGLVCDSRWNRK
jgi:hypothetical protein